MDYVDEPARIGLPLMYFSSSSTTPCSAGTRSEPGSQIQQTEPDPILELRLACHSAGYFGEGCRRDWNFRSAEIHERPSTPYMRADRQYI